MLVKTYSQKLTERIESVNSNLCVGLDPRVDQIDGDFEAFAGSGASVPGFPARVKVRLGRALGSWWSAIGVTDN